MKRASMAVVAASLLMAMSTAAQAEPIKIGVNQPLTGPFAASGTYIVNGARLAVAEINANGGVLGEELRLVIEDNKSNPTEAAAVAEKLIVSDKVPVMMGAWGSSLTLAAMPRLMQYQVPMLVETSSASNITRQGNPYVFRISPPSWVEGELFREHLPNLDIEKVDFLAINNDWGIGTINDFTEMLGEEGIEIGLAEMMDQGAQDLSAQLSKIRASDSDTVIVTTAVEQLTLLLRQAAALGLNKQIITTGGSQNPDQLIDQAGSAANGTMHMVFFAPWEPEKTVHPEKSKAFIDAWEKAGHDMAGLTESYRGYDGIMVIKAAIEKAGVAEPEAIKDALWEVEVPALNGIVTFFKDGPEGRESGQYRTNSSLIRIVDGKVEILGS